MYWVKKFRCTFRGVRVVVQEETSFVVHFLAAAAVIVAAALLRVSLLEWCALLGCVFAVLTTELINSSIERVARAIDKNPNPHLRDALDIAGAAVLVASLGAVIVGALIFASRLYALFIA